MFCSITEPIVAKWLLNILEIIEGSLIKFLLSSNNLNDEDFKGLMLTSDLIPFQMSEDFLFFFKIRSEISFCTETFLFGNFIS